MRQEIITLLDKLNLPLSIIERDLGFGNGLLGKIKKEENRKLSEENFVRLKLYYKEKTGKDFCLNGFKITPPSTPIVGKSVLEKADIVPKNHYVNSPNLQAVLDKINKDFGEGSVMNMGDVVKKLDNVISTGSIGLNNALGIGGLPCGRMVEISGQESTGKTTLAIHVIVEAQRNGSKCAIVDAEQSFDSDYAKSLGVDLTRLDISQPDYGEQALEIADRLVESKEFSLIIVDSVAALVPKRELENESGDSAMGRQAMLMSQACRKMIASVAKSNTLLIWINQLRNIIGGMPNQSKWITTGGNALKFYASVRLDIASIAKLKDGEEIIGNRTKVVVKKNKCAPPFRSAEFDILFGTGIDKIGELIEIASKLNIIQKSGSWFSYGETKLGQGANSVKQILEDHPDLLLEIENKVINHSPIEN